MFMEERQQKIYQILDKEGRVLVKDLSARLGVSIDTIRRDLIDLEKKGFLKRTRGGAIPGLKVRTMPQPPAIRYSEGTEAEQAIAEKAASYISKGDTVFISSAHLHYVMLDFLPRELPFAVVTNSVVVADRLKEISNIDVYVIGGKMRASGSIVDAIAVGFLLKFKLDLCFLVGAGLSADFGVSTSSGGGAAFQRASAQVARRVICLSTHNKLGHEAFQQVVPLEDIDLIITEEDAPADELQRLRERGAQVVVVPT